MYNVSVDECPDFAEAPFRTLETFMLGCKCEEKVNAWLQVRSSYGFRLCTTEFLACTQQTCQGAFCCEINLRETEEREEAATEQRGKGGRSEVLREGRGKRERGQNIVERRES